MHLVIVVVGLVVVGLVLDAVTPLEKISDTEMHQAQDKDYTKYAGYHPYYSYGPYSSAAEAEAAKTQQGASHTRSHHTSGHF